MTVIPYERFGNRQRVKSENSRRHPMSIFDAEWVVSNVWGQTGHFGNDWIFACEAANALVKSGHHSFLCVYNWNTVAEPEIHYLVGNRKTYEDFKAVYKRKFGCEPTLADGCIDKLA